MSYSVFEADELRGPTIELVITLKRERKGVDRQYQGKDEYSESPTQHTDETEMMRLVFNAPVNLATVMRAILDAVETT